MRNFHLNTEDFPLNLDHAVSAVNSLQQNIVSIGVIRILSSRIVVCELSAVCTHWLREEEGKDIHFTIKGF
jgi:hypothetical protein